MIVVCSVCSFALVEFFVYEILDSRTLYDPIDCIGMIGPMGILLGVITRKGLRQVDGTVSELLKGIRRVSEGDYNVELNPKGKGPFRDIYSDFNRMCRRLGSVRPGSGVIKVDNGDSILFGGKSERIPSTTQRLRRRLILLSVVLVIASVCVFALVEFFAYKVVGLQSYDPVGAVGMIFPMALVFGCFIYFFLKRSNRYFTMLVGGISRIAAGDFNIALNEDEAGPFREIFETFNRMCRELRGIKTLRDDFVRQFSHEFRTPIMSINGFANLMLEEEYSREEQIRYLEIIASESQRLSDLAGNTLLLAKLESQQWLSGKSSFSLDEQLRECIIMLEPEIRKKNLRIVSELSSVMYYGNRDIIQQVWINLLANAARYTPEKGLISVKLAQFGESVLVAVSDTGDGIPYGEISKIYDKYFKGARHSSGKGLGLGLSIVKKIIDLCGGRIEVESETGRGSVFTVYLPSVTGKGSME